MLTGESIPIEKGPGDKVIRQKLIKTVLLNLKLQGGSNQLRRY